MVELPKHPDQPVQVQRGIHAEGFAGLEQCAFQKPWRPADFHLETPYHGWYVGDASRPAAFLYMQVLGEEAELLRIATHPASRRKGLARILWNRFVNDPGMAQVEQVFLEVSAHNEAARNLYCSLGFEESGRRRAYYGPSEDAVLMTWQRRVSNTHEYRAPNSD